jgi:hypothetical protein
MKLSHLLLFLSFLVSFNPLQAQHELNNFSATGRGGVINTFANDYQALGVNPANLGRSNPAVVSFTLVEGGFGANSQAMRRDVWRNFLNHPEEPLSLENRRQLAQMFANDNVLNLQLEINTFALSVQHPKLGGIALSNRHRFASHVRMNQTMAEVFFFGQNAPVFATGQPVRVAEAIQGSSVQGSYLNEWNLAYGRKVLSLPGFELALGAGYRYVQGIGAFELTSLDGEFSAFHSLSPIFKVDYGRHLLDPNFNLRERERGLQPVGSGHGFDLGLSAEITKSFRLALSVTDIGSMQWEGNLLVSGDELLKPFDAEGATSYDFFGEAADIGEQINKTSFSYGPRSSLTKQLPTRLRTGIGFQAHEKLELGLDVVVPLNNSPGNIPEAFVGLGVDYRPVRFLRLSSGLTTGAGDYWNLPLGLGLVTSAYEFGIGTRNILGMASDRNPGMSVAVGFLRFKIGRSAN